MQIQGRLYEKDSAAHSEVSLSLMGDQYHIDICGERIESGLTKDVEFSSRIGNAERKITLASGSVFATHGNDEVDAFIKQHRGKNSFIHILESKMQWVLVAIVVTIGATFSFVRWGIPTITYVVAESLPHSVNVAISAGTLDFLDRFMFEETKVSEQQQAEITARFYALVEGVDSHNDEVDYKLYFRAWGSKEDNDEIPNALALPSGEIILTDKFIELANNQDEIDSVLLHEIGHVRYRHSLKMVIQGTIIATLVTVIAGDASGFADMGIGLGSLLITTHYSRKHESEADYFAFTNMLALDIDPAAFANIMNKMTAFMIKQSPKEIQTDEQSSEKEVNEVGEDSIMDYLSSHPKTQERVEQAEQFSKCYKEGRTECPL